MDRSQESGVRDGFGTSGRCAAAALLLVVGVVGGWSPRSAASASPRHVVAGFRSVPAKRVAVSHGGSVAARVMGVGGVPTTDVRSVALRVVSSGASRAGTVIIRPEGLSQAAAVVVPVGAGRTTRPEVVVTPGPDGRVDVVDHAPGSTVTVLVVGYRSIAPITVTPSGVVEYHDLLAPSLDLVHTNVSGVAGQHIGDGGCEMSGAARLPRGASGWSEDVAVDPATCVGEVVSGRLPRVSSEPKSTYVEVHVKGRYVDPADITITSLTANLRWPLRGHGKVSGTNVPYKFRYDGWRDSGTPSFFYTLWDDPSVGLYYRSTAQETFRNIDFEQYATAAFGAIAQAVCEFNDHPAVFSHDETINGWESGGSYVRWRDHKSGGCANLVHHAASYGPGFAR